MALMIQKKIRKGSSARLMAKPTTMATPNTVVKMKPATTNAKSNAKSGNVRPNTSITSDMH